MCAARYILAPPFSDIGDRSVYSEAVLDITLDIFDERFYNIAVRTPGVAKLGIALGSGPRDRGFKSRHSDQIMIIRTTLSKLVMCSDLSFLLKIFFRKSDREHSLSLLIYNAFTVYCFRF